MSQGTQLASRSGKRLGNGFSSGTFRKELSPADALLLAQQNLCQTSELWNCKIINVRWFQPLSLWRFITAAKKNKYTASQCFQTERCKTVSTDPRGTQGRLGRAMFSSVSKQMNWEKPPSLKRPPGWNMKDTEHPAWISRDWRTDGHTKEAADIRGDRCREPSKNENSAEKINNDQRLSTLPDNALTLFLF